MVAADGPQNNIFNKDPHQNYSAKEARVHEDKIDRTESFQYAM